ncbi:MAG: hypothetical protein QME81_01985 [bacterium]|nr:hypothetical protein [bacterium]
MWLMKIFGVTVGVIDSMAYSIARIIKPKIWRRALDKLYEVIDEDDSLKIAYLGSFGLSLPRCILLLRNICVACENVTILVIVHTTKTLRHQD